MSADIIQKTAEALELLGKGYESSYEIHKGETVIRDSETGQQEYDTGAWVKIAAPFRNKHLKSLKGSRLGVWLCIVLHINEKNDSHPSIETICEETGYSNREVIDCIKELEEKGYLTVIRGEKRYNIYHVNFGAAYGIGNNPTCEESSQVKKSARNSELSSKSLLKTSLKEEPFKKNQKKREVALDFSSMTVSEAFKVPTLKLYKEAADFFPGSILWEMVHNTITQNNLTFEKIHAAAVAWAGRGFKPSNVQGILEWAVNGIPSNGKTQTDAKPALDEKGIQETQKMLAEKMGGTFVPRPANIERPRIGKAAS